LWEWLQRSLKLRLPASKGLSHSHSKSPAQLSKNLSTPKDGNIGKPASGNWAASLGLKMRLKTTGAEESSSSDTTQAAREGDFDEDQSKIWDLETMRSGPGGVPAEAVPVLSLFCASYAHLLMVVDDEQFYERQVPFTMDQQRLIAAMLNTMVYNGLMSSSRAQSSLLTESAVRCLRSLYERDCRRSFCEPALWLAPAVSSNPPTAAAARAHHEVSTASTRMRDSFQVPGVGAVLTTIPHVFPFEQRCFCNPLYGQ
jgi:ubiquitin-protein ligase E3 B